MTARGSALECAAVIDAMRAVGIADPTMTEGLALLVRIVSMLTKMIARESAYAYAIELNTSEPWG